MVQVLPRIGGRRALLGSVAALVVLGLLAWWLWPHEEPPSGTITLSTGADRGVYQEYGMRLKHEIAGDMPRLTIKLKDSNGSQMNVKRVATGEADFAIAAADAVQTYLDDHKPGAGKLRGLARLYDDYVQVVVPVTSPIQTIADLKGKRVAVGPEGSGVRLIAERVLAADGLDIDKDIEPRPDTIGTSADALRSGRIDAFFWSGGLPTKGLSDLAATGYEFRFIPITSDLVAKLHGEDDSFIHYRASVMPADAYPTILRGSTVPTITVANLLITREDMDPRLTEWLTRMVIKSRDTIGQQVHAAQLVDLRTAIYTDPLLLQKGAKRYYQSVKP
ncbi:TAXI family TRAP transporter solute-binding subunit [Streptomyces ipomoeae]|uniref:TRAP transporter solute receptor, TAXI family n=2 Tax=Streptomyces ipomoeae TaxID=103232 RepID=L1L361_9ACTN|nr:TAXI family TRAP transporter solute-binding subunit [Streptomyces ipomoeae]EKX67322.1 TRAP transporter solute receptor, TAXI family [Streptomyces ipomoeae 91-03]MDX2694324.1 TAXI family TRAP transporter solute-binding subunit [Streptomyces ipomoeae]MDX2822228.1 TAXI family TRAP transporter solute-binding subunit [Streptomyces ipomoeae]MDX2842898.1 TAXI family TRAP transporter solute-binding subunit [Streptomyces ipomoeae]MDX2874628.1 TAXI family TRAP transporter solute-binding subunit [Stre